MTQRIAVIGAGPSGITAAKNLIQHGLTDLVVFERNGQVGGNWIFSDEPGHSSVYESTHIISSKALSQYLDYPMPSHYPDYPSHAQLLAYFQAYARDNGVEPYIRFNTGVAHCERLADGRWRLHLEDGAGSEEFDQLVVCNGHHWAPREPAFPGSFSGEMLHSTEYRRPEPFAGKRVLVVGGGNSGSDIAVAVSRKARFVGHSTRRGYYVIPKFMMGKPIDVMNQRLLFLPAPLRRLVLGLSLRLMVGRMEDYGLQTPDHKLLQTHPVLNSDLLNLIKHGRIHPRRNVARFDGNTVRFEDGHQEEYDAVILATGYRITFPFLDDEVTHEFTDKRVPLFLHMFHPRYHNLAFIGLVQPLGCIWPLSDLQARLLAHYLRGTWRLPDDFQERTEAELRRIQEQYLDSPRHSVEVDFHRYSGELVREIPEAVPVPW